MISLPSSASTQELYEAASAEFGNSAPVESLKGGFPPRSIPCDGITPISTLLSNQERVQVVLGTSSAFTTTTTTAATTAKASHETGEAAAFSATGAEGNTISSCDASGDEPSSTTQKQQQDEHQQEPTKVRKSKRAAAKAATEAMPALIKAQLDQIKESRQATTSPSKKRPRTNTTNAGNGRSNSSSANSNSRKQAGQPKPVALSAATGPGRRLADGAVMVDHVRRATNAGRRAAAEAAAGVGGKKGSNTDMSEALLGALHDKGQMGVVLRRGMKNAVQASYETTRAFSRLAAIQGQSYQLSSWMEGTSSNTLGTTAGSGTTSTSSNGSFLKVVYHGTVDKVKVEETVDLIPLDVLKAVIEGIYSSDREALRPENLSRLSPRVLWSCVHYQPNTPNVAELYHQLLPHLDWTFFRRRAPQLSEKALENQRQAEEAKRRRQKGGNIDDSTMDMERAAEAVAAVEHAMEHLQDYQTEERKARQAQAALARLAQQQQQQNKSGIIAAGWSLTTPSEPDRDELRECIESSLPPLGTSTTSASITKWITKLMKECHIHNWRELANVTDPALIATKLEVGEEHVQAWIDHAQDESVAEIVVHVCDNNVNAVEILTEGARTGTPKDLAAWRAMPELLLDQLRRNVQAQQDHATGNKGTGDNATTTTNDCEWMDLLTIATWCNRAHRLLQDYEWLNWYATPIE